MGWLLDSFDVMLYALVLAALMADLNMSTATGGSLASVTLAASAVGGILFGVLADRFGRVRALIWSILTYSVFTAACGFAQSVRQLAVFRVFLGIGMGGEWASGAALISETWPAEHRGKALGLMQSSWALGYAAAAVVTALVLPTLGWRAVFFVGILPALFTVWIRRRLEEPEIWQASAHNSKSLGQFSLMFRRDLRSLTVAVTLMNACIMFAWWGFNLWIPAYLSLSVEDGGIGLSAYAMTALIIAMQVGMWFGYVMFGFVSDRVGRKRTYIFYVLMAAALILAYTSTRNPIALLVLGPFVAFFGTGSFSGFGAVTAEIYPTEIRATAQGFTYNIGRLASAAAPWVVGSLAETHGFASALSITSTAFILAAIFWIWIPETRG
ncbi:MAG TPA: MFS transporter, partial [Acidobacteria bacterium]|nr:MFS transporter [Acidobacteriota bacterium]